MKLYSSDLDRIGMLSSQAFRAARLVVDSGIHTMGWTRQQAIDYMLAHTAEASDDIAAEVDRYIIWPGQATAYMLGMLEIRRARDGAQQAMGQRVRHQGVSRSCARGRRGSHQLPGREDSELGYDSQMNVRECILFSGGAPGAEAEFGACAERHGIEEVNFTFEGHKLARHRGVRVLNHEELQAGDVSLEYVSKLMARRYTDAPTIRKILQTIWYQVNSGQEIYVIGTVLDDGTVRGGTGWGAEFAKLCNKPLHVFDQDKDAWFSWSTQEWKQWPKTEGPVITHPHFTGTGTRTMQPNSRAAIEMLFARSFPLT